MKKPHRDLLALHDLGMITGCLVGFEMASADSGHTTVTLISDFKPGGRPKKTLKGRWPRFNKYLDQRISSYCIMELTHQARVEVEAWRQFEKENAEDLAEFARLKKKLGRED